MAERDWFAQFEVKTPGDSATGGAPPPTIGEVTLDPSMRYRSPAGRYNLPSMAMDAAPHLAGAMVPAARPLAAMRGVPGALARMGAAGLAGAGAEAATIPARRMLGMQGPRTFMEGVEGVARAGAGQVVAQGVGEAMSPFLRKAALRLTEAGLSVPGEAERIYQKGAARREATLPGAARSTAEAAIKHGPIAIGGQTNPRATRAVSGKRAESAAMTERILGEQKGVTYSPTDAALADEISSLKQDLAPAADRRAAVDYIDAQWRKFIESRRMKGGPGRLGKLERMTAQELNAVKQEAQSEAKKIYDAKPGRRGDLRAKFNEALARGAKKALEREDARLAAAAGKKPQLPRQNALTGELIGLEEAVSKREMLPRKFGGNRWMVDPRLYLENPTLATAIGTGDPGPLGLFGALRGAPGPTPLSQALPRLGMFGAEQMWPMPELPPWAR